MSKIFYLFLSGLLCLQMVQAQDEPADYSQALRPQYHFTSPKTWIGSPAAALYYDGNYHLFYEYSPVGNTADYVNMGHAVSTDLVNWDVKPVALKPDDNTRDLQRCGVRLGSALIDEHNVLGLQNGTTPTFVLFYTSYECGIRMAYSTDAGENWVKAEGAPVIPFNTKEAIRDPKVFYYAPDETYVMVVARNPEDEDIDDGFSFYSSTNLKDWEYKSHMIGPKGRPDVFQLQKSTDDAEKLWVMTDSIGSYMVGEFTGRGFIAETGMMKGNYGTNNGAVSWTVPTADGDRVIQIASIASEELANIPFAGQLSFPVELSLDGTQLLKKPVKELAQLEDRVITIKKLNILPGLNKNPIKRLKGKTYRMVGTFDLKTVSSFGFMLRNGKTTDGIELRYDAVRNLLSCQGKTAPLNPVDGKIQLDILVDRSSVEVFANDGHVVISTQMMPVADADEYILYNTGGELYIDELNIYPIRSVYGKK